MATSRRSQWKARRGSVQAGRARLIGSFVCFLCIICICGLSEGGVLLIITLANPAIPTVSPGCPWWDEVVAAMTASTSAPSARTPGQGQASTFELPRPLKLGSATATRAIAWRKSHRHGSNKGTIVRPQGQLHGHKGNCMEQLHGQIARLRGSHVQDKLPAPTFRISSTAGEMNLYMHKQASHELLEPKICACG